MEERAFLLRRRAQPRAEETLLARASPSIDAAIERGSGRDRGLGLEKKKFPRCGNANPAADTERDMQADPPHQRERSDDARLAAWRAGDARAAAALVQLHYRGLTRFFRRKVGDPSKDDLVHETLLACLESAARFRGQSCFRTFLFGIAHRVLASHLRRLARRSAWHLDDCELEELPASAACPIAPLAAAREHTRLQQALRRLPPSQRQALELHYWQDLTAAQIGARIGVPLGTAKTRLRDGRRALEAALTKPVARAARAAR